MKTQLPLFTAPEFQQRSHEEIVDTARAVIREVGPGYGLPVPTVAERVGVTIDLLERMADDIVAPENLYLADGMFCVEDTGPDPVDAAWDLVLHGGFDGDPADLSMY